jgi:predicted nucleic acid-binding protein
MRPVFVDTAGWMMLADGSDPGYRGATRYRDKWLRDGGIFVTSDYVLDETLTLIRMRLGIDAAERWWNQISASPRLQWEWIDPNRAEAARTWFFRWRDKDFSITDCSSFVVTKELRLDTALTTDRHFVLAGFRIAPAP